MAVLAPAFLRGMRPGGAADVIAQKWAQHTGEEVVGFDPSGSFGSFTREVAGHVAAFSFSQLVEDVHEVIHYCAEEKGSQRLNLVGCSIGGAAVALAASELAARRLPTDKLQIEKITLLQTPPRASEYRQYNRYDRFKALLARRDGLFFGDDHSPLRLSLDFLDAYLERGDMATVLPALNAQQHPPQLVYVASRNDEEVGIGSVLALHMPPNVRLRVVDDAPHDTTDERAIERLVQAALE